MIWFSVRQETAEVCGPRIINRIRGGAYLKFIRLSAHYRCTKFVSDVAACVAVTVSGGVFLFHGNHRSRANNRGNAFHFPRDCMKMFNIHFFFSHKLVQHGLWRCWRCRSQTASYVHLFVFFLLVTGFNPAWFGQYGFLEDEGLVHQAGEKHLRCAPFGWCNERRLQSWYEDGACDVQTRAARCGEHWESRMVRPLCTNRMLSLEGPMRGRETLLLASLFSLGLIISTMFACLASHLGFYIP
jgi:hypothetical protein